MQLTTLEESGLEVSRDQILSAFAPFVAGTVGEDDSSWRDEVRRRKRKVLRKYVRQLALGWLPAHQRSERAIIDEYTKAWRESEYASIASLSPRRGSVPGSGMGNTCSLVTLGRLVSGRSC